jgi:tripartite-type tricarboxylate transporter receptor subunit TctC
MKVMARLSAASALVLAAGVLAVAPAAAQAQPKPYPNKDIHVISAFPPGSGADVLVRFFAEHLRPLTGRNIIVENKSGAGGNIATEYVAKAKPDGYTIFIHAGNTLASNYHLIRNNKVDASKQIQIAATINRQAFMLVVDKDKPWKNVNELTAYLKEKGEKGTYAFAANGGAVMCAIYKQRANLKTVDVGYKMAQDSLNDMASGAVDFGCQDPVFALSQAREGRVRILGIGSKDRLSAVPDIPTMTEQGYPMDLIGWFAAMVPAATPRPIVNQINGWFAKIHKDPLTAKFLINYGGVPWMASPDEGQARLLRDIKDWGEYVRIAKLKPQG